jgi:HEPN domain-containing protein
MNRDDAAAERAREGAGWLAIAREDLRVAGAYLALDPPARGMAVYHCQQAAEKSVKGLLAAAGIAFRKTPDLDELADLVPTPDPAVRQLLDTVRPLTVWGFAYRYPTMEDAPEPVPDDAELRPAMAILAALLDRVQTAIGGESRNPTSTSPPKGD